MRPEPGNRHFPEKWAVAPVGLFLAVLGVIFLTGCTSVQDLSPQSGRAASTRKTEGQVAHVDQGNLTPQFRDAVKALPTKAKEFSPKTQKEADDVHVTEIIRRRRNEAYARILIEEGNVLREKMKFQEALDKYHQAEKLLMAISAPTLWDPRSTMEEKR